MAERRPFPEDFCSWLAAISFDCELLQETDFAWPVIGIGKGNRLLMRVIPLPLNAWRNSGHTDLSDALNARLTALRHEGIPAVVLSEDYWVAQNSIVCSRLAAMLGVSAKIPARLTQVRRIDNASTSQFLENNHLNGNTMSKFRYGLFLPKRYYRVLPDFVFDGTDDELLVAVATFSNARIFELNNKPFRSHELIRFASLLGTNVVGALDKLLNAFIREKSPDDIMTYADLEWSDGRSYLRLGFEERGGMSPREAFVNLETNQRLRKLPENMSDSQSTECLTVYNLGSIKYVRTINPIADNEQ